MGIYSKGTSFTESASYFEVEPIECELDDLHEAALTIVAESEYNYNMLIKAVGVEELAALESEGTELVYTESTLGGFFEKIKAFFLNILAKIKGLWNRFVQMFDGMTKSGKAFAEKYKKELYSITVSLTDFKYKGYVFTIGATGDAKARVFSKLSSETNVNDVTALAAKGVDLSKLAEDSDELHEKLRGAAIKDGDTYTASEFNKALFEHFRNGENQKEELDNIKVTDYYTLLSGSDKAKTEARKAFDKLEKEINDQIKALDKARDEILRDKDQIPGEQGASDVRNIATYCGFVRTALGIVTTYNGALVKAMKDEVSQAKSICVALLHYKPKKESAWDHNVSESGYLTGVQFK